MRKKISNESVMIERAYMTSRDEYVDGVGGRYKYDKLRNKFKCTKGLYYNKTFVIVDSDNMMKRCIIKEENPWYL